MSKEQLTVPGVALIKAYIEENNISRAELARRACAHGKVDRVTLVNILEGHITRVSVEVAVAISKATGGEIPVESLVPVRITAAA